MSLCMICGTIRDVKRCATAAFNGAPTLQDKFACSECFHKAIEGKKQDVTYLTPREQAERDERLRLRNKK